MYLISKEDGSVRRTSVRYYVHDRLAHVANELRNNSYINPRYWVMDRETGLRVDEFTTKAIASATAADLNREAKKNA